MTQSEQIEEILYESHSYGIREEVLEVAKKFLGSNKYEPVLAYEQAFQLVLKAKSEQDN